MPKKAAWRAVKRHRNYTVDEASRALNVAKGTVRRWIKDGLPAISDRKPALILGDDLNHYLKSRKAVKQKCRLDECFCFKCREPKRPALNEIEFHPVNSKTGNLRALCETCTTLMHKRMAREKLPDLSRLVTVEIVNPQPSSPTGRFNPNQGRQNLSE
ncbi:MAG: helix-turn-helix domain-containing protein [Rhizobiaceae bacterium]